MRIIATSLLAAMGGVYLLARHFLPVHPVMGYVLAFAEAGMVGGMADWFAVTALFRRPLGLPIPHTAIIPENKDRIADTMATFLREYFLTPQVVARRLAGMNLAGAAGTWLADPGTGGGSSRLGTGAAELGAQLLESLDPERLGVQVRGGLVRQLGKLDVAPLLGQLLTAAIADRRHLPVIDGLVRWAGLTIEDNEDLIRKLVHDRANSVLRWTGLDERLASSVIDGLYKLLAEVMVDPDHPLRSKIEEGLATLADRLLNDPEMGAQVERLKAEILANPAVAEWWQGVWERIRLGLIKRLREPGGAFDGQFADALAELGATLRDDPALQAQINRFARRTLVGVASRYGDQIVRLVSETVRRWDAQTVTDRIEGAVGRDLQFIRINGTLVGGLVGVAIHAIDQLL
ncbi:uncharacterized membrane-anchored protein YjiN (DUF445 family) [Novosphingobium kunmingense]|uniref:Uncharacterized membrane-anchored protein YjiN (DUF445 family) n=1 Tax=Novosphingobium kunmingense TaxID=1211806 RepID=A0A2N0H583_9SPHN|nr:DUF445 domain-containing protein [Novosphingobium kunmingense]PKB14082.1 uncharacterized membrane-anchored protein YjiN (DUF445 family) [Novosphingobium kunmingense]